MNYNYQSVHHSRLIGNYVREYGRRRSDREIGDLGGTRASLEQFLPSDITDQD